MKTFPSPSGENKPLSRHSTLMMLNGAEWIQCCYMFSVINKDPIQVTGTPSLRSDTINSTTPAEGFLKKYFYLFIIHYLFIYWCHSEISVSSFIFL